MVERLSEEAVRMCRMCRIRSSFNGSCDLLNRKVATQNKLAEDGECTDAEISGSTTRFPQLYNNDTSGLYANIVGRMKRLENGDWVFESGTFT